MYSTVTSMKWKYFLISIKYLSGVSGSIILLNLIPRLYAFLLLLCRPPVDCLLLVLPLYLYQLSSTSATVKSIQISYNWCGFQLTFKNMSHHKIMSIVATVFQRQACSIESFRYVFLVNCCPACRGLADSQEFQK